MGGCQPVTRGDEARSVLRAAGCLFPCYRAALSADSCLRGLLQDWLIDEEGIMRWQVTAWDVDGCLVGEGAREGLDGFSRGLTLDMFSWCRDRRFGLLLYWSLRVYCGMLLLVGSPPARAMATW